MASDVALGPNFGLFSVPSHGAACLETLIGIGDRGPAATPNAVIVK